MSKQPRNSIPLFVVGESERLALTDIVLVLLDGIDQPQPCDSVAPVTGLRCTLEANHPGLHRNGVGGWVGGTVMPR